MEEVIRMILDFLCGQGYSLFVAVLIGAMTTFIFIILSILKVPIKAITNNIRNEKLRKLANKVIILLAFGLSIGLWVLGNKFFPEYIALDRVEILLTGALPIVAYALGDGIITKPNAKAVVKKILEVTEDGRIDNADIAEVIAVVKTNDRPTTAKSASVSTENLSEAESVLNSLLAR